MNYQPRRRDQEEQQRVATTPMRGGGRRQRRRSVISDTEALEEEGDYQHNEYEQCVGGESCSNSDSLDRSWSSAPQHYFHPNPAARNRTTLMYRRVRKAAQQSSLVDFDEEGDVVLDGAAVMMNDVNVRRVPPSAFVSTSSPRRQSNLSYHHQQQQKQQQHFGKRTQNGLDTYDDGDDTSLTSRVSASSSSRNRREYLSPTSHAYAQQNKSRANSACSSVSSSASGAISSVSAPVTTTETVSSVMTSSAASVASGGVDGSDRGNSRIRLQQSPTTVLTKAARIVTDSSPSIRTRLDGVISHSSTVSLHDLEGESKRSKRASLQGQKHHQHHHIPQSGRDRVLYGQQQQNGQQQQPKGQEEQLVQQGVAVLDLNPIDRKQQKHHLPPNRDSSLLVLDAAPQPSISRHDNHGGNSYSFFETSSSTSIPFTTTPKHHPRPPPPPSAVMSGLSELPYRNAGAAVVRKIFSAATAAGARSRKGSDNTPPRWEVIASSSSSSTHVIDKEDEGRAHLTAENSSSVSSSFSSSPSDMTAVAFARTSPKAGFLHKLGQNIHMYKRRFFVLKPTTYLYYFVSPNDVEPRGCIDLESTLSTVRELECLPDGRFRFEILLHDNSSQNKVANGDDDGGGGDGDMDGYDGLMSATLGVKNRDYCQPVVTQRIVLEARSAEIGQEWISSLRKERLSHSKGEVEALQRETSKLKARIADLEEQVQNFRLVERDRDGAIQDAAEWRERFRALNEALRLLTRQISRPPPLTEEGAKLFLREEGKIQEKSKGSEGGENDKDQLEVIEYVKEKNVVTDDGEEVVQRDEETDGRQRDDAEGEKTDCNEAISEAPVSTVDEDTARVDTQAKDELEAVEKRSKSNEENEHGEEESVESSDQRSSSFATISEEERRLDKLDLNGTNFSALSNACRQLRENLRLTSIEANTAVEDVNAANEKIAAMEARMAKAERHLCKLWEENCAMRDALKKKKREKKVLVREVRSLLAEAANRRESLSAFRKSTVNGISAQDSRSLQPRVKNAPQDTSSQAGGTVSEEQRLILELEEHVMSSLRLHEQFMAPKGNAAQQHIPSSSSSTTTANSDPPPQTATLNANEKLILSCVSNVSSVNSSAATVRISNNVGKECKGLSTNNGMTSSHAPQQDSGRGIGNEREETREGDDGEQLSPLLPAKLSLLDVESGGEDEDKSSTCSEISSTRADLDEQFVDVDIGDDGNGGVRLEGKEGGGVLQSSSRPDKSAQELLNHINVGQSRVTPFHRSTLKTPARLLSDEEPSSTDHSVLEENEDSWEKKHPLLKLDEVSGDELPPHLCGSSSQSESSKSVVTDNGQATSRLACPLRDVVQTWNGGCSQNDMIEDGRVYHLTFYTKKIGLQFQKVPATPWSTGALTEAMTADVPSDDGGDDVGVGRTAAELRRIAAISRKAHNSDEHNAACPVATPVDAVLVCGFYGFDDSANNVRPRLGARLVAFDGVSVEVGRWTFESVRKAIHARGRPLTLSFRNDFLTMKQRAILTKAAAEIEAAIPPPRPTVQYRTNIPPGKPPISSSRSHIAEASSVRHVVNDETPMPASARSGGSSQIFEDFKILGRRNLHSLSEPGSSSVFSSTVGPLVASLMSGLTPGDNKNEKKNAPSYLRPRYESLDKISQHHDFQASLL